MNNRSGCQNCECESAHLLSSFSPWFLMSVKLLVSAGCVLWYFRCTHWEIIRTMITGIQEKTEDEEEKCWRVRWAAPCSESVPRQTHVWLCTLSASSWSYMSYSSSIRTCSKAIFRSAHRDLCYSVESNNRKYHSGFSIEISSFV